MVNVIDRDKAWKILNKSFKKRYKVYKALDDKTTKNLKDIPTLAKIDYTKRNRE